MGWGHLGYFLVCFERLVVLCAGFLVWVLVGVVMVMYFDHDSLFRWHFWKKIIIRGLEMVTVVSLWVYRALYRFIPASSNCPYWMPICSKTAFVLSRSGRLGILLLFLETRTVFSLSNGRFLMSNARKWMDILIFKWVNAVGKSWCQLNFQVYQL